MNILYFVPDTNSLRALLTTEFTPLSAYSFMAFTLIYIPCLATIAIIQKETRSWKWTAFSIIYALIVAYLISLAIYKFGSMFGFGP